MATTSLKLPTIVRALDPAGGGAWTNINNAKLVDATYATCTLPNGATYTPSSQESAVAHVLPPVLYLSGFGFSAALPANAVVTGITMKTVLFANNGGADQSIEYLSRFYSSPDEVPTFTDDYLLFQPKETQAPQASTAVQTLGGATDIWSPEASLAIDGMYLYSTSGAFPGYEVMTSTLDPFAYDFFYNGHDLLIQPTTAGYNTGFMDAAGQPMDYTGLIGKTITLTVPGVGDFTLTGQAGGVTAGDATFQAAFDNNTTVQSISEQFLSYANGNGVVIDYISISYFQDVIWQWTPYDTGTATNLYRLTTNASSSALLFPNNGYFSGGSDPDPSASTMASGTAVDKINNESGAPILARVDNAQTQQGIQGVTITNTLTHFTLKTSVPASIFRDTKFGIVLYYSWEHTGGTPGALEYPHIADNNQKLDYVQLQLTYTVSSGGAKNMLLMGMG